MWDTIVVGGGCAGLAAATALAEKGRRVLVLEKRPLLGGRTSSFRDAPSGEELDNGQHLFLGCYEETRRFLARIGATSLVPFDRSFDCAMVGHDGGEIRRGTLRSWRLPAPFHLLGGLISYRALPLQDRLGAIRVALAARSHDATSSVTSVTEWLNSLGQSREIQERLWDPLCLATLNIASGEAPAELFLTVLRDGFLASSRASRPGLSAVGLSELFGEGSSVFLTSRSCEVRIRAAVNSILVEEQRAVGVCMADGSVERSHSVILAVPPPAARDLADGLTEELRLFLEPSKELHPSPIISLHVWVEPSPFDASNRTPFFGLWGRPFHWLFRPALFHRDRVDHLSLVISGARREMEWSKEDLIGKAEEDIRLISGRSKISVKRAVLSKESEATWVPPLKVGRFRPSTRTPLQGLYLAGDWTDTGLPCTIEGAVKSGHRAAEAFVN